MTEVGDTVWRKQAERPDAISPWAMLLYGLLATGTVVLTSGRVLGPVLNGGLLDPDSYMRLVRIEATQQAHAVVDVIGRDGSGAGTLLYWSHLLDSLILVLAAPLALVTDWHTALLWACAAFGPLSLGGLGAAVAWAGAPFADRRFLWLGPVLIAVSPATAYYGLPGVAHHHVLLVVATIAVAGWAARMLLGGSRPRAGWSLGAWAGAGIWLSPEAMPFVLMGFLALWLGWVLDPQREDRVGGIRSAGLAFLLVVGAAFVVDPPDAGYGAVEIDRLSVVYVVLAMVCCLAGLSVTVASRLRFAGSAGRVLAIGIAVVGCAAWLGAFPAVLRGPGGLMDAASAAAFFDVIAEMQPVRTVAGAVKYLLGGAIAAAALSWFAWRQRSVLICYAALCAIVLIALGAAHQRFAAYAEAVAAVMLPVIATRIGLAMAGLPSFLPAMARIGVIALALLASHPEVLAGLVGSAGTHKVAAPNCSVRDLAAMLRPFAGQVVLADVDDTPELLYRTEIVTVGSLYHQNVAAFLRLRAAWRSLPSDTEPDAVRETGARAVLFCPPSERSLMIADLPPDTLADRLARGEVPPWLAEVAVDRASGNVLYRVVQ